MSRSDDEPDQEILTLYVNTDYGNEVTLGGSMADDLDSFGDVTWREFIADYRCDDISTHQADLNEWLEEQYGISSIKLDEKLDGEAINRYYTELSLRQDNVSGRSAKAFDLIRSLNLFAMDRDGNGAAHGVQLDQSLANGPRKSVWIDDQNSADWLVKQAGERGVLLKVVFA